MVNFHSYAGINLPWGLSSQGVSTYGNAWTTAYDEAMLGRLFDFIASMGIRTVGIWMFADRFLIKDATWGTPTYVVKWNQTYLSQFDSFLNNVVKPRGQELIISIYKPYPWGTGNSGQPWLWENDLSKVNAYVEAVRQLVTRYGSATPFGPSIAAWVVLVEGHSSQTAAGCYNFSKACYDAIKTTGTTQPVFMDSDNASRPATTPANLPLYLGACDGISLHGYLDNGIFPDTSHLPLPFIVGEFGASDVGTPPNIHLLDPNYNLPAVQRGLTDMKARGAGTFLAWSIVGYAYPDRTANTIMTAQMVGGKLNLTLGPVGTYIRDFNAQQEAPDVTVLLDQIAKLQADLDALSAAAQADATTIATLRQSVIDAQAYQAKVAAAKQGIYDTLATL